MYIYSLNLNNNSYNSIDLTITKNKPEIQSNNVNTKYNILSDFFLFLGLLIGFLHILLVNHYIFLEHIWNIQREEFIKSKNFMENNFLIVISLYVFILTSIFTLIINESIKNWNFWIVLVINILMIKILHYIICYFMNIALKNYHYQSKQNLKDLKNHPEIIDLHLIGIFEDYTQIYDKLANYCILPYTIYSNFNEEYMGFLLYFLSYGYPIFFILY